MALYAALLYYPADRYWTTPEEIVHAPEYDLFGKEAAEAGVLRGGQALHPATMSTTITVAGGAGGDVVTTDGPYAETAEVLGGVYFLEAADLDEALRWGAKIPAAWHGKVEVRPVVDLG
jgi:hypothetical protein